MTKTDMKAAAMDKWRVRDDFGAIGIVVGIAGPKHICGRVGGNG